MKQEQIKIESLHNLELMPDSFYYQQSDKDPYIKLQQQREKFYNYYFDRIEEAQADDIDFSNISINTEVKTKK